MFNTNSETYQSSSTCTSATALAGVGFVKVAGALALGFGTDAEAALPEWRTVRTAGSDNPIKVKNNQKIQHFNKRKQLTGYCSTAS